MKSIRVLCFLALAAGFGFAPRDGILLRRQLKQDTTTTYTVVLHGQQSTSVSSVPQPIEASSSVTMDYVEKVGDVASDGKSADLDLSFHNIQAQIDGPGSGALPSEVSATAKVDDQDHISETKFSSLDSMMAWLFQELTSSVLQPVSLPDTPVNVGDTWAIRSPLTVLLGDKAPMLTAKLVGDETVDGIACWHLNVDQDFSVDGDITDAISQTPMGAMLGGASVSAKGGGHVTDDVYVEKDSGRIHKSTTNTKSDITLDISNGTTVDVAGTSDSTMTLKG